MCDYSLHHIKSRPAQVGDKLVVRDFGAGTRGFAPADSIDRLAVCVMPGTEIAFDEPIEVIQSGIFPWKAKTTEHKVAIFRQINKDKPTTHHDCLEFPDGQQKLLTLLTDGQTATVLQLPAAPKNEAEAEEQKRLEVVG